MSSSRFVVPLALLALAACRSQPEQALAPEDELVTGCVSTDYTMLEVLAACTREHGSSFVFDVDVERELAQMGGTWIGCFIPEGTKRSDIRLPATIEIVQQHIWRARGPGNSDLMIDREPLPGTKTYRIYRLPK